MNGEWRKEKNYREYRKKIVPILENTSKIKRLKTKKKNKKICIGLLQFLQSCFLGAIYHYDQHLLTFLKKIFC